MEAIFGIVAIVGIFAIYSVFIFAVKSGKNIEGAVQAGEKKLAFRTTDNANQPGRK